MNNKIFQYTLIIFIMGSGSGLISPLMAQDQIPDFRKEIEFIGKEKNREKAILVVDKSLKRHGKLGVYGDLSSGIRELTQDHYVMITDTKNYYQVMIAPDAQGGHDFCMKVDKNTYELYDVVIGEILPEPGPEEDFQQ